MNVVNYLKSNSLDQLKSEYRLRVKQYPEHGLLVLNYLSSAKKCAISNECRGLIISTHWKVISRSFDRFFNYNESGSALHNDDECYAIEKIDGSLIKIYKFNGMWCVSTRGTAFAEYNVAGTQTTYKQAVFEALGFINAGDAINEKAEERFQQFCRDCNMNDALTYICELTGKHNHIVTPYNPHKYELWLLGIRRNDLIGKYTDINSVQLSDKILRPKQFTFRTIEECVERANNLPNLQEGFVIYNRATSEPILKVKSPIYVRVHNSSTNGNITDTDIYRMAVNGEWTEFLAYNPTQKHKFDECFLAIGKYFGKAQKEYEDLCKRIKSEKDFQIFMNKPWKALAISIFKKNEGNLHKEFLNWDETKQLKFLVAEVIQKG